MNVGVIGAGYVGLVTGSCLAYVGNKVKIFDINSKCISMLNKGKLHIYEKGLRGFMFWQYRPEVLGHEAPAWGVTKPDGSQGSGEGLPHGGSAVDRRGRGEPRARTVGMKESEPC